MLAALSFEDVLSRAPAWGTPADPLGQRLISIVFAGPSSPVWRDLETNRAFLDARSGDAWDLFFAGMSAYGKAEPTAIEIEDPFWNRRFARYFNPGAFAAVEEAVYHGQIRAGVNHDRRWRYSGGTDLVSFMCYARAPDWASLRAIRIEESMTGRPLSLGRITEGLARWAEDAVDEGIAPGAYSSERREPYATSLGKALAWTASAVSGGVLGDAAYDLLKVLLGK